MKKFLQKVAIVFIVLVIPFCFVACDSVENGSNVDLQRAINLATRSVMTIETSSASDGIGGSAGSGVICKIDNHNLYLMTNWHVICKNIGVIDPALTIKVAPANAKAWLGNAAAPSYQTMREYWLDATVIGGSVDNDIAILKVSVTDSYVNRFALRAANYHVDEQPEYGKNVFAVGNAIGIGIAASEGIISSPNGSEYRSGSDLRDAQQTVLRRLIRTTAAVQQGNSGGGLFNEKAELVGIVQSKIMYYGYDDDEPEASGNPADNVAFAVPVSVAGRIAEQMIARDNGAYLGDDLKVASLGILCQTNNLRLVVDNDGKNHYLEDVVVTEVVHTTSLGLAANDIILSATCHGETVKVTQLYRLKDFLISCWADDEITLTVQRNGEMIDLTGAFWAA